MSSGIAWFLVGIAVYMLALYFAQFWVLEAKYAFLRRYRAKQGVDIPLSAAEVSERFGGSTTRYFLASPARSLRLMRLETTPVDDPELEQLRHTWRSRRHLYLLGAFVGFAIPVGSSCAGQW